MATVSEQCAAFDQVASLLRSAAAANARAYRTTMTRSWAGRWSSSSSSRWDPLALLYGRGTYENLSGIGIVQAAVGDELRLAAALEEFERHHP